MKLTSKTTTDITIAQIVADVRSGEHLNKYHVGDILEIGGIEHVIIGLDVEEEFPHSMTVQRHNKIYDHVFSYTDNRYETSDIRAFLNGDYAKELPEDFVEAVQPVTIDGMETKDRFYLLSSEDLDLKKSKYPYYHKRENRTHYDEDGFSAWYWLRDPYTGYSYIVRSCGYDGFITSGYAYYGDRGLSPACTIA